MSDARKALEQKISDEGCDGHEGPDGNEYEGHHSDDCPDGDSCAQCNCWGHVAGRYLDEADAKVAALVGERDAARETALRDVQRRLGQIEDTCENQESDLFSEGVTEGVVKARFAVAKMIDALAAAPALQGDDR